MPTTTSSITGQYWEFYVEGREERRLKNDIDPDQIATALLERGATTLRDAVLAACEATAKPLDTGRIKRTWLEEHANAIAEAGGDAETAYGAWVRGRVDELAYTLEEDVVSALAGVVDGDEEDDDTEDEDDED